MHFFSFVLTLLLPLTAFTLTLSPQLDDSAKDLLTRRQQRPPGLYGPVIDKNFPDPCILKVGATWWSFATRDLNSNLHIQVASSPDFKTWNVHTGVDALPRLPPWVNMTRNGFNTWAPDVVQLDDGRFLMYFSATSVQDSTRHCVGAAYSHTIQGPYTALAKPFVCPLQRGGAIDPAGFRDPSTGKRYVLYKVDGNSMGSGGGGCGNSNAPSTPTPLEMFEVSRADGVSALSSPTQLLDNAGAADMGVVENPAMLRSAQGWYFLFFSAGCFNGPSYSEAYATSRSPLGPFVRAPGRLIVTGDGGTYAPGGADVWLDMRHMVFHSGYATQGLRKMWTAVLKIVGNRVSLSA